MTQAQSFARATTAFHELWTAWLDIARRRPTSDQAPAVLELKTICHETGCHIPELDAYARVQGKRPAFLVCGGDEEMFSDVAGKVGCNWPPVSLPESPIVWILHSGNRPGVRFWNGNESLSVTRQTLSKALSAVSREATFLSIEEDLPFLSPFDLIWMPYPKLFNNFRDIPEKLEIMLSQRASLIFEDYLSDEMNQVMAAMGQILHRTRHATLDDPDERRLVMQSVVDAAREFSDEANEQNCDQWNWVIAHIRQRIYRDKETFRMLVNDNEKKLLSIRQLMHQQSSDWPSEIRSICESYLLNRVDSPACAAMYNLRTPLPPVETFIVLLGLPALWSKLEQRVNERMSVLIPSIINLAEKFGWGRFTLGELSFRWNARDLSPKLIEYLNDNQIIQSENVPRGGLIGSLKPRKQLALDERKAMVSRAIRIITPFIESEFNQWCDTLLKSIEERVVVHMAATTSQYGYSDPESLRRAITGLDRIDKALSGGDKAPVSAPEGVVCDWMSRVAEHFSRAVSPSQ
jgi:hypothetical protein